MKTLRAATKVLRPGRRQERRRKALGVKQTRGLVEALFGLDMHATRLTSLSNGVAGVLSAAVLSIHAIGQAYALLAGTQARSGVKQIDRLLSNDGIDVAALQRRWVEFIVGVRKEIVVAMDWTEFEKDDHSTLCIYLVTSHGRATPLVWQTVQKSELLGRRTGIEHELVERLHGWLDRSVAVELLADRGFGDQKLYGLLMTLGWDFEIRFR